MRAEQQRIVERRNRANDAFRYADCEPEAIFRAFRRLQRDHLAMNFFGFFRRQAKRINRTIQFVHRIFARFPDFADEGKLHLVPARFHQLRRLQQNFIALKRRQPIVPKRLPRCLYRCLDMVPFGAGNLRDALAYVFVQNRDIAARFDPFSADVQIIRFRFHTLFLPCLFISSPNKCAGQSRPPTLSWTPCPPGQASAPCPPGQLARLRS